MAEHFDGIIDEDEPKWCSKEIQFVSVENTDYADCVGDYQYKGTRKMYPWYQHGTGKFQISFGHNFMETMGLAYCKCWALERVDVEPVQVLFVCKVGALDVPGKGWETYPSVSELQIPTFERKKETVTEDNEYLGNENLEHVSWTPVGDSNPDDFILEKMTTKEWKYIGYFMGWSWKSLRKLQTALVPLAAVNDSIFVGGQVEAGCWPLIEHYKITHLLNMAQGVPLCFPNKLTCHHEPLWDTASAGQKMLDQFDGIADFIAEGVKDDNKILVHCQSGISRACTAVCAYLIKYQGMSDSEAIGFVKQGRTISNPNAGFRGALCYYHLKLHHPGEEKSIDLRTIKAIK